ncbi:DUF7344 domain-containing protein [Haloterrigena alkaliphila]|uniref:DUF7344 domain-containing protein n=1 Tax=Haloterrigena alkaliphila TaxID=2816475 RepID=A0A8A2VA38_9EURY|nr:hypothetical protein [Haloterrigena alkaliphila]QSW98341.1 hypothetical protein J0X25_13155 [Haloterrigena alkaliphila]
MDPEQSSTEPTANPDALDDAFLALRDRDRRFALYFLLEHETASVAELADVVTAWSHAADGGVIEPQCRNQRYRRLLQTHVPKLADVGVVAHDEEADRVSLAPCPEPIRELAARACAAETGS